LKTRFISFGVALAIAVALLMWFRWQHDAPRRNCFNTLQILAAALISGNADALLQSVVLPASVSGRTPAEQTEFLAKALRDEISAEGLAVLRREGQFGSLTNLFPDEAKAWAQQAGVKPEDCVAFRMERGSIRAEVVLVCEGETYRVVRCNNVKQLAPAKL